MLRVRITPFLLLIASLTFPTLVRAIDPPVESERVNETDAETPKTETKVQWYRTEGELTALPESANQWMNSAPLSLDALEGKGLVLYYFEEQCPSCEKRWPQLLSIAEQHSDEPVVFVAVNSGNTSSQIAGYLKRNKIDWPVIVDPDRSFEQSSLGKTISLQNIYQTCVLTAKGEWHGADSNDLGTAARAAAEGGEWIVDPAGMPEGLRQAWQEIEIGNYPKAARAIMRAGREGDAATKQAAKQLFEVVKKAMDDDISSIAMQLKAGQNWPAYQSLELFIEQYDGYPMNPAIAEKHKEVGEMEEVKNQYKAAKKLAAAIRTGSKNRPDAIEKGTKMLEKLIADFPNTEAAEEAQELLDKLAEGATPDAG